MSSRGNKRYRKKVVAKYSVMRELSEGVSLVSHEGMKYVMRPLPEEVAKSLVEIGVAVETLGEGKTIFPYHDGKVLADVGSMRDISPEAKVLLTLQLVNTLNTLHSHDVIHGDINFYNIIIDLEGERSEAHLIDYGHSRLVGQPLAKYPFLFPYAYLDGKGYSFGPDLDNYCMAVILFRLWSDDPLPSGNHFYDSFSDYYTDLSDVKWHEGAPQSIRQMIQDSLLGIYLSDVRYNDDLRLRGITFPPGISPPPT
jgi:serine/threonine protein kinase